MRKQIDFKPQARQDIRGINREDAMHILHAIDRYATIREGDVKRLQDVDPP